MSQDLRKTPDYTGSDPLTHPVQLLWAAVLGLGTHEKETREEEYCGKHAARGN